MRCDNDEDDPYLSSDRHLPVRCKCLWGRCNQWAADRDKLHCTYHDGVIAERLRLWASGEQRRKNAARLAELSDGADHDRLRPQA